MYTNLIFLVVLLFVHRTADALVNPRNLRSSLVGSQTTLRTTSTRLQPTLSAFDQNGGERSAPYIPPEFTVEDGEEEDASPATIPSRQRQEPPDYEVEDDDPYAEGTLYSQNQRPKTPRRKASRTTKTAGTNWMEKNAKFSPDDDGMASNESFQGNSGRKGRDGMRETRSKLDAKTFRQDFRGTRVFVQGIPPGTSWQDLKDHFKNAGSVVFASVSVDPQTGESKGHGIVQFETTAMAQNAIEIMRDFPLNGSELYVREDVQENSNPNAKLSSAPKGPTPPTKWKCANEDNVAYMSSEDLAAVRSLIKARDDARRRRKYDVSDRIRDELKHTHGVFIDDRLQMWWTAIDGNKVPQTIQDIKGDGLWKLPTWRQIPTTPENDACVNPDLVEGLLKQRDIARREKDFSTADALLEEARNSPDGELTLRIHDESRTWRVWTEAPPPQALDQRRSDKPTDPRERAVAQCIEIVEEFAPDKIGEIKMVLEQFEGREFQVLKRLKNQYLS